MFSIRSPRDFVGGLALLVLALLAVWQAGDLEVGRAMRMGPGYFPRVLSYLIAISGALLVIQSLRRDGEGLERWHFRHLLPVLIAIVLFALTIRPLGLVLSGVLLVVTASFAAPDLRWRETLIFGAVLIAFAALLFPVALGLPLPIWPRL